MRISEGYRRDENSECETSLYLVYQESVLAKLDMKGKISEKY